MSTAGDAIMKYNSTWQLDTLRKRIIVLMPINPWKGTTCYDGDWVWIVVPPAYRNKSGEGGGELSAGYRCLVPEMTPVTLMGLK
jgi:hypothetical protein